jgi:hypothetical protein
MPKTRVTRSRLKNHLHYGKWIYALIAVAAFFLVDLAYTMTEYRPDKYHRVDFQLVGNSMFNAEEALEAVGRRALEAVAPQDERLETVEFYNIAYTGDAALDYAGTIKYTTMLAVGDSAVYFVNRPLLRQLAADGGVLKLDEYIAAGVLPAESAVRYDDGWAPEEDPASDAERALGEDPASGEGPSDADQVSEEQSDYLIGQGDYFAIELSGLGLMLADDIGYDSRDKYAVIVSRCVNPDTAAAVLGSVIEQLSGPVPDSAFAAQIAEAKAQAADGAGDAGVGGIFGAAPSQAAAP